MAVHSEDISDQELLAAADVLLNAGSELKAVFAVLPTLIKLGSLDGEQEQIVRQRIDVLAQMKIASLLEWPSFPPPRGGPKSRNHHEGTNRCDGS